MSPEMVSQLSVGGSTLVLLGGLMMLWRRGVAAHIGAFTFQSVALAATMAMVGWFAGDWQLWAVAAALLLVKGIGIPLLLKRMERRFGSERELEPYVNTATSLLIGGLLVLLFVPVHGAHSNVLSVVLSPLLFESEALVRAMVFL